VVNQIKLHHKRPRDQTKKNGASSSYSIQQGRKEKHQAITFSSLTLPNCVPIVKFINMIQVIVSPYI
jgi:hypothetical protein